MIKRIILLSLVAISCHGAGGIVTPTISGGGGGHGGAATNLTPWTSNINGAGNSLSNVNNIDANFFFGDGSGLTGITASNAIAQLNGNGTNTSFFGTTTFAGNSNVNIRISGGGRFNISNAVNGSVVGMAVNGAWVVNGVTVVSTNSFLFLEQYPVQTNAILAGLNYPGFGWYTLSTTYGYYYTPTNSDPATAQFGIYETNFTAGQVVHAASYGGFVGYWTTNGPIDGIFPNSIWHPDPDFFMGFFALNVTNVARSQIIAESMVYMAQNANESVMVHEGPSSAPFSGGLPIAHIAISPIPPARPDGVLLTNSVTYLTNNGLQVIIDGVEIDRWTYTRNAAGDQIFYNVDYGNLTLTKYAQYIHANGIKYAGVHLDYGAYELSLGAGINSPGSTGSFPFYHQDATNVAASGVNFVLLDSTDSPDIGGDNGGYRYLEFIREIRKASVQYNNPIFIEAAAHGSFSTFNDWFVSADTYTFVADEGADDQYLNLIKRSTGYRGFGKYPILANPLDASFTASAIAARRFGCFQAMGPCNVQWLNTNNLTSFTVGVQTNTEFRNVWKDVGTAPGWQISSNATGEVWARQLANGSIAVFMLNLTAGAGTLSVSFNDLKIAPTNTIMVCRDIFERTNVLQASSLSRAVDAHEGAVWVLSTADTLLSAPSGIIPLGKSRYSTNASYAYTGISGWYNQAEYESVQNVTNSLNSLIAITPATAWKAQGVWNVTNETVISISVFQNGTTNAIAYPKW